MWPTGCIAPSWACVSAEGFHKGSKAQRQRSWRNMVRQSFRKSRRLISEPRTKRPQIRFRHRRRSVLGDVNQDVSISGRGKNPALLLRGLVYIVESRVLILNHDPVFEDRLLSFFDTEEGLEIRVVRTVSEAVLVLMAENFGPSSSKTAGHISRRGSMKMVRYARGRNSPHIKP